jgi:hypothetical protein
MRDDSLWCADIEEVLAHLEHRNEADHKFIRERVERFCPLPNEFERHDLVVILGGHEWTGPQDSGLSTGPGD